jgi:hypothetical protein
MTIKKQFNKLIDDENRNASKQEKDAHTNRRIKRTILNRLERFDQRAIFDPEEEGAV